MEEVIEELREIKGVKNVRKQSGPVLRIELFSREIPGSEAVEIRGDLRSISQRIVSALDEASSNGVFDSWEWIVRPEKQYQETGLGRGSVSDRKEKGHRPGYYRVSILE